MNYTRHVVNSAGVAVVTIVIVFVDVDIDVVEVVGVLLF